MAHALTIPALILQMLWTLLHPAAAYHRAPAIPCTIGPPPVSATDRLATPMARWTLTVARSGEKLCGWTKPQHK